ncbi:MAG: hypothetical protein HKN24_14230 [Acidimicrobiales bacterium]|nr:hypothetical protein [Acidimicrobiales bacterium]
MDLFTDSGPESQVHDLQPGISTNKLFWVTELAPGSFGVSGDTAGMRVRNLPLVDSFVFLGETQVSAAVDIDLVWRRTGHHRDRGKGKDVDPTDPAAFLGRIAESDCYGYVSGREIGKSFRTRRLTSSTYYAQFGTQRNGVFLD